MLLPIGILDSSGGAAAAYELISTTILASDQSEFIFSAIPGTYKHLQVRIHGWSTGGNGYPDYWRINLNSDGGGGQYSSHQLKGDGSSVTSLGYTGQASMRNVLVMGDNPGANRYGAAIVDLLDYASTSKYKTVRAFSGAPFQSSLPTVMLSSGLWFSGAAVSSISFTAMGGPSIAAPTRFSIYGIKG